MLKTPTPPRRSLTSPIRSRLRYAGAALVFGVFAMSCNAVLGIDPPNVTGGSGGGSGAGSGGGSMTSQLGAACTHDLDCISTHCVDGVCCDGSCQGPCTACNLPNSKGSCVPVASGETSPKDHPPCDSDPKSTCSQNGSCDGAGQCALWPEGTACKASKCTIGILEPTSTCDGMGNCVTPKAFHCDPYVCDPETNQCYTSCSGDGQCKSPSTCSGGSCGQKADGATCTSTNDCLSGHCEDGVCCATTCTGICEACNLAATLGTCAPKTGQAVHGGSCTGYGMTCGGSCNGADGTSCTYPGAGTTCNDGNACTYLDHCSSGACVGTTVTCPMGGLCTTYSCNGTSTCVLSNKPAGTECGSCNCGDKECNANGVCKSIGCIPQGETCP